MYFMKRHLILFFLLFTPLADSVFSAKLPNVVVFPLKPTGVSTNTAELATERIRTLLGKSGRIRVLERNQIDAILTTVGKNLDDCTTEGCGIEIGRQLDADKIVTGSLIKVGKKITITVNLLNVATTERQISVYRDLPNASDEQVIDFIAGIVNEIAGGLPITGHVNEVNGNQIGVDLGSANGVTVGMELIIENVKEITDAGTGETRLVAVKVGTLTVAELAGKDYSYCTPKSGSGQISVGMTAQVEPSAVVQTPVQVTPSQGESTSAKERATLQVTSDPYGATVYLDGNPVGKTPLTLSDLESGERTLTISKEGYESISQPVRLSSALPKTINSDLILQTGSISITTDPSGAMIFLDGTKLGQYQGNALTKAKLKLGKHTIKATLDCFFDSEQTITVVYNKTAICDLTLKPKPGAIFIMTTPEGAGVSLDGKLLAQNSPYKIQEVTAGEHSVLITFSGYNDILKTVIVPPGKTLTLTETMGETTIAPKTPKPSGSVSGQKDSGNFAGLVFVQIPGGSFEMGSSHQVVVPPFKMQNTELTQRQWVAVMGTNPSQFKGDDLPVEQVSWNDIQTFIQKLNQMDPGKGYRLPSESEWEYACKAGTLTKYNTGDNDIDLERAGWVFSNSDSKTHSVSQKAPNKWGLYDMHGNVWEWCSDAYNRAGLDWTPNDGTAYQDDSSASRIVRGGSWGDGGMNCRSTFRFRFEPTFKNSLGGFRLVCR